MRILLAILFDLVEILFHGTQNLLKGWGLKGEEVAWVAFRLGGDPPYRRQGLVRRRLGARRGNPEWEPDLETFGERLEAVAGARGTRGVVLRLESLELGRAKAHALAGTLRAFRESSGKEVVVWAAALEGPALALGLAADRILVAPAGRVGVKGAALEVTTARRALEKLGASAVVVRRGTHKAAGEVLTEDGISEAYRETLDGLLDDGHAHALARLQEGRGVDAEVAASWIDRGPYTAADALDEGLIDGICYGDEVADHLERAGAPRPKLRPWPAFAASQTRPLRLRPILTARPHVAVLSLRGLIVEGESRPLPGGSRTVGDRTVAEALAELRKDERVKAIVLRIDSRGGSAHASDLIWHEVKRTAEKKPVIAWMENVAASGGYYIAAAAHEILAAPLCLTGSIGVIASLFDLSGVYERLGLRRELLARGDLAALGTTSRAPTEEELAHLDHQVGQLYQVFKERVAAGRGLELEEVEAVAQGRVFTSERAKEHRLIDRVGGFESAVDAARRRAGIAGEFELDFREPLPSGLMGLLPGMELREAWLPGDAFLLDWAHLAARAPGALWAVELLEPPGR
ncbi:MAG: signal peptide peptidase SppA [Deltaproteobacteria bacterium]|nr:signal peptide peptidase SppA [Deltaproteobacteria bacterium]